MTRFHSIRPDNEPGTFADLRYILWNLYISRECGDDRIVKAYDPDTGGMVPITGILVNDNGDIEICTMDE